MNKKKKPMGSEFQVRTGVVGGTLLSALFNIGLHDILFTAVLSVVGAVVSFFVSYFLKLIFQKK